jgi:hypothetical protein
MASIASDDADSPSSRESARMEFSGTTGSC